MLIKLIGSNNEMIEIPPDCREEIDTARVKHCIGVAIFDTPANCQREHFPVRPALKAWAPNRQISTLPEPPAEVR